MKHIKTPVRRSSYLEYTNSVVLVDADDEPIGQIYAERGDPVIDEVITALNARNALVEACRQILGFLVGDPDHEYYYQAEIRQLRTALAKVQEMTDGD